MVRKILCKKCEKESRKLFPTSSPYPGEFIIFTPGIAKKTMMCDDCGLDLAVEDEVCAFSISTDRTPYYPWEEEFITITK